MMIILILTGLPPIDLALGAEIKSRAKQRCALVLSGAKDRNSWYLTMQNSCEDVEFTEFTWAKDVRKSGFYV